MHTAGGRPEAPDLSLRAMEPRDLAFVVSQHRLHFPDGFFARLGPRFLTAYYRSYAFGPGAHSYIAQSRGHAIGYLVGVTDAVTHRQHLLGKDRRSLAVRGSVALAMRPRLAAHFVRTRAGRYGRAVLRRGATGAATVTTRDTSDAAGRIAVLTSVAVTRAEQSRGAGSLLIERFLSDAATDGCELVRLVTLSGPAGASEYYTARGWQQRGQRVDRDKRSLTTFEWRLGDGPTSRS